MNTRLLTLCAVAVLVLLPFTIHAEEPAAAEAAAAPSGEQTPAPAEDGKPKVFSMTIGESEGKAVDHKADAHGITITVDGDDDSKAERGEIAGKAVDRVVGELESALAGLPEDIRSELDAEDLAELRGSLEEIRRLKESRPVVHEAPDSVVEAIVPVIAILLLFGGPIVIVAIVSFNNRRKRQMVHETIDRIIAQGKDVPVELLEVLDKGQNGKSRLARGAVNIALGVGLGAMLYALSGPETATVGLIPLCIGIAHLLVWKLEKAPADRATTV